MTRRNTLAGYLNREATDVATATADSTAAKKTWIFKIIYIIT